MSKQCARRIPLKRRWWSKTFVRRWSWPIVMICIALFVLACLSNYEPGPQRTAAAIVGLLAIGAGTMGVGWQLARADKRAAVDLVLKWATSREDHWDYAVKFAASLKEMNGCECASTQGSGNGISPTQAFWELKAPETIANLSGTSKDYRDRFLRAYFNGNPPNDPGALTVADFAPMQWRVQAYLNLLESIAMAWSAGTADEKMLEDELRPLMVNNDEFPNNILGLEARKNDRNSYPFLWELYSHLDPAGAECVKKSG